MADKAELLQVLRDAAEAIHAAYGGEMDLVPEEAQEVIDRACAVLLDIGGTPPNIHRL